jgi:hypothetical protein
LTRVFIELGSYSPPVSLDSKLAAAHIFLLCSAQRASWITISMFGKKSDGQGLGQRWLRFQPLAGDSGSSVKLRCHTAASMYYRIASSGCQQFDSPLPAMLELGASGFGRA